MKKRVILITGGSQGLGEGIARALSSEHTVVILSHEAEDLKSVSEELGCSYQLCDVTDMQQCKSAAAAVVKEHGRIDVLINNAGVYARCSLEEHDAACVSKVLDVNVRGPIFMTQAVLPYMKKQGAGTILNIVSQVALRSRAGAPVYDTSKCALAGFTQTMEHELRPSGIRVMGLYPGRIATALAENSGTKRDMKGSLCVEDVAKTVAFMLSFDYPVTFSEVGIKHVDY